MRKIYTTITLLVTLLASASNLPAISRDVFYSNIDWDNWGYYPGITDEDGNVLLGANGYIMTVWLEQAGTEAPRLVAFTSMSDTDPTLITDFGNTPGGFSTHGRTDVAEGETVTLLFRAFQLDATGPVDIDYLSLLSGTDIAARFAAAPSYGEYAYETTGGKFGMDNPLDIPVLLTWKDNGGGQIPEPSTYAMVTGLAMIAYLLVRRHRG